MKYEILKKTLLYRLLAFIIGLFLTTVLTVYFLFIAGLSTLIISLVVAVIVEINSIGIYYMYEFLWRRYIEHIHLKEGTNVLCMNGDSKVRIAYEVIEDLGEGKLIIKVI